MKKEQITKINDNGSYSTYSTTTTTPEDGFVPENITRPNTNNINTFHMGYSKNDPRVTRPFVYIMCSIFIVIGLIALLLGGGLLGILMMGMGIYGICTEKKKIDAIAKNLKEQQQNKDTDQKI